MPLIEKYINQTFTLLNKFNSSRCVILKVGKTKSHSYNQRPAIIYLDENKYLFKVKTIVPTGTQNHKEIRVNRETEIELKGKSLILYTIGKDFFPNSISLPDFSKSYIPDVKLKKNISGEITSIATERKSFYYKERYYRILFPLSKKVSLSGNFTGWFLVPKEKCGNYKN